MGAFVETLLEAGFCRFNRLSEFALEQQVIAGK
jgi:hypothetical protein